MPTGYTYKLCEKGESFKEFVLHCARAFGACVEMKDSPMSEFPPEAFQESDYYRDSLRDAIAEQRVLLAMTDEEKVTYGEQRRINDICSERESLQRGTECNRRLEQMAERIRKWKPPSPQHDELKQFMLKQIADSMEPTHLWSDGLNRAMQKAPIDYYNEAVDVVGKRIPQAEARVGEERKRTADRNTWLRQLRESLEKEGSAV